MTTLQRGDRSSLVRSLQQALIRAGFNPGNVDGVFGARTEEAVRAFQRAHNLMVDGIVGDATWAALAPYVVQVMPTLRRGSTGSETRFLQQALRNAGYNINADGIFGARTEEAVRAFQRANNLTVDGIVGPRTWAALQPFIGAAPPVAPTGPTGPTGPIPPSPPAPGAGILRRGDTGPDVCMLQLALSRAGFNPGAFDCIFGARTEEAVRAFQRAAGITVDGIAGPVTIGRLRPYLTGFFMYTVQQGDTLFSIARRYGTTVAALLTANPRIENNLIFPGERLVVPLGFAVVPANIPYTADLLELIAEGLVARYPFISSSNIGKSVAGQQIPMLKIGAGRPRILYNAAQHANEWITTPLVLRYLEDYAEAVATGGSIGGSRAMDLYQGTTLYIVPMVNPDGVDLVTGDIPTSNAFYKQAQRLAQNYPHIPFPSGWKANINGVDLDLNYPDNWETARSIKFRQGFTQPGPMGFVGTAPLSEPESRAMVTTTDAHNFDLTVTFGAPGEVIYWRTLTNAPQGSQEIGQAMASASGYSMESTQPDPYAGYNQWFVNTFNKPGFKVMVGTGREPLPLSQFPEIYRRNVGLMTVPLRMYSTQR